jgi:hypothetical protein
MSDTVERLDSGGVKILESFIVYLVNKGKISKQDGILGCLHFRVIMLETELNLIKDLINKYFDENNKGKGDEVKQ